MTRDHLAFQTEQWKKNRKFFVLSVAERERPKERGGEKLAQMQVEQWAQEHAQQMPMHGQFDPDFFHNNFMNPEQVNPVVDEGAALDNHLYHHIAALEAGLDGLDGLDGLGDSDESDDSDAGQRFILPDGYEDEEEIKSV